MTREEAQQILGTWLVSSKGADGQRGYIEGWFDEEDAEAFRMAIEALKAPTENTNTPTDTPTDLISRQDAIKCVRWGWSVDNVVNAINVLPSADAVEVVRCMNCIYGEERIEDYRCRKLDEDWDIRFKPTHFCSYGERREP